MRNPWKKFAEKKFSQICITIPLFKIFSPKEAPVFSGEIYRLIYLRKCMQQRIMIRRGK